MGAPNDIANYIDLKLRSVTQGFNVDEHGLTTQVVKDGQTRVVQMIDGIGKEPDLKKKFVTWHRITSLTPGDVEDDFVTSNQVSNAIGLIMVFWIDESLLNNLCKEDVLLAIQSAFPSEMEKAVRIENNLSKCSFQMTAQEIDTKIVYTGEFGPPKEVQAQKIMCSFNYTASIIGCFTLC